MGADHIAGFAGELNVGNNFSVCVYPDSLEACEHLMQTLSEGGRIVMPFEKQFFGYMGLLIDAFGVQWMITYGTEAQ